MVVLLARKNVYKTQKNCSKAHLVGSADEVKVMAAQELGNHVLPEGEGHAAVVLAPAHDVLVGVRPQQVAQQARVGDVCCNVLS